MDVVSESHDEQSAKERKAAYVWLILILAIIMATILAGTLLCFGNLLGNTKLSTDTIKQGDEQFILLKATKATRHATKHTDKQITLSKAAKATRRATKPANRTITCPKQLSLSSSTISAVHTARHADDILKKLEDEDNRFALLNKATHGFSDLFNFLDLINPKHVVKSIAEVSVDDVVIVATSFKNNYMLWNTLCKTLMKYPYVPERVKRNFIVYLVDKPTQDEMTILKKLCPIIQPRFFPFEKFPKTVQKEDYFSYQPLIVALMLLEYKVVFLATPYLSFEVGIGKTKLQDYVEIMKQRKIPFAFSYRTGHSIYAATNPAMFSYLPMNESEQKKVEMWDYSGTCFISTESLKKTILLRLVQCALIRDCIAPKQSNLECNLSNDRFSTYAHCHRYAQSAMNIIARNYFPTNESLYFVEGVQWSRL